MARGVRLQVHRARRPGAGRPAPRPLGQDRVAAIGRLRVRPIRRRWSVGLIPQCSSPSRPRSRSRARKWRILTAPRRCPARRRPPRRSIAPGSAGPGPRGPAPPSASRARGPCSRSSSRIRRRLGLVPLLASRSARSQDRLVGQRGRAHASRIDGPLAGPRGGGGAASSAVPGELPQPGVERQRRPAEVVVQRAGGLDQGLLDDVGGVERGPGGGRGGRRPCGGAGPGGGPGVAGAGSSRPGPPWQATHRSVRSPSSSPSPQTQNYPEDGKSHRCLRVFLEKFTNGPHVWAPATSKGKGVHILPSTTPARRETAMRRSNVGGESLP